MAISLLDHTQSPLNFEKFKKHPNNSNRISLWAFMVSIIIYISVFYTFNLSPSNLLCTPKFWFITLNTLILIIASDFRASRENHDDFYGGYHKFSATTHGDSSFVVKSREKEVYQETRERIIRVVESKNTTKFDDSEKVDNNSSEKMIGKNCYESKNLNGPKNYVRSISGKLNISRENEEKLVMRKTLSEKYDRVGPTLEEDEFSIMSDEELNRRVEEFIRRFNMQIRFQAGRASGPSVV
ncbi:Unknown protein [Striga hermonthica]|uniref:DUF4408 domain-containing protein n=1 Tax=Striga hermonthica TaxID=68872 RepID=A0A9N7RLC4_STRHE|nr:Unknown protein [Striga hermonthica]